MRDGTVEHFPGADRFPMILLDVLATFFTQFLVDGPFQDFRPLRFCDGREGAEVVVGNGGALGDGGRVLGRADRKSQIRQCFGFCTADLWSSLA